MSLRAFHAFFITVSILFAFGFGVWGLRENAEKPDGVIVALAVASLVAGVGLVAYLVAFLKKSRGEGPS